jgi:hypothetical protein
MLRVLLKDPLLKEIGICYEQIPANNDWVANRTPSFTRTFVYRRNVKQSEVSDASRPTKQPHMFFVIVRFWPHEGLGTWIITVCNQVTSKSYLSAGYCTLFKVRGH